MSDKKERIEENAGALSGKNELKQKTSADLLFSSVDEDLSRERDMFHLLLDNSHDAIYFKDLESRYLRISRGHPALQYIDSPEAAIGKTDFDYFPLEHAQAAFNDEMNIIATGKPILGKLERETAEGTPEKWVYTSKLPMYNEKGEITGTFGISRDITKIKAFEDELSKAKNCLEERVRLRTKDLQKANADLKKHLARLDFLNTASYEMAQCNGIPALVSVILKTFSLLLENPVLSLHIEENKQLRCAGISGLDTQDDKSGIFSQTINAFSLDKLTVPEIVKNWVMQVPEMKSTELSSFQYLISVPLLVENRVIGLLQIFGTKNHHMKFSEERCTILTLVSHSAVSLCNAIYYKEISEKAQLKGELEAARRIQQRLMPCCKPNIPGIDLKGFYSPAYEVGGDYLDYFKNDAGCWVVVIADVCGKGIPAAMMMTLLRSSFRTNARNETSAKNLLCSVNDSMRVNLDERLFVTSLCMIINPQSTGMTYARAGHPRMIHMNIEDGTINIVNTNGVAFGIFPDLELFSQNIEEVLIPLKKGDRFFIYTDGLTEAFDITKSSFGLDKLIKVLGGDVGDKPETMIHAVVQSIREFTQGAPYHDDLTFISMYVNDKILSDTDCDGRTDQVVM